VRAQSHTRTEPRPLTSLGNIKGMAFREFLAWYEQRHGGAIVEATIRDVESRHHAGLVPEGPYFGVLASRWYPAEVVHDLLDQLTLARSEEELEKMAADAASSVMTHMLRGVYRAMFSLIATPERYVRHAGKLWSTQYDTGESRFTVTGPTEHRVTYVGWTSHHPFICRLNMAAGRPILEAMHCRDVESQRISCVSSGAAKCENLMRWRAPLERGR
jgi:hypothetical protein